MGEALPFVIGIVIGGIASFISFRQRRWLLPIMCVVGGFTASAINGEMSEEFWGAFVGFDALLTWVGAALSTATIWGCKRIRSA